MAFISHPHALGLDISDLTIRAIELGGNANAAMVTAFSERALESGIIEDGEIRSPSELAVQIRELIAHPARGKFTTQHVVASLPESKSYLKVVDLPLVSGENVLTDVQAAISQHVPFPFSDLVVDWEHIPQQQTSGEMQKNLIGAVPRDIVHGYMTAVEEAGYHPVALEIESLAIVRAVHNERSRMQSAMILLDIGLDRTTVILYDYGSVQMTSNERTISGRQMTELVSKELRLTWDEAEDAKRYCGLDPERGKGAVRTALQPSIDTIVQTIQRTISFYLDHVVHARPVEIVRICGGGANLRYLTNILTEQLKITTEVADPLLHLDHKHHPFSTASLMSYPTVIGLGLRGLAYDHE